ncbi:RelA/SpoT [Penicillium angulare]|uniref:RelA/SpoT n=1 Tax=Penicillium angulare TaxID=116970 RepID=UPI00253F675A|nr:RelA/SpoT [Penicillium angulare]KAJ5291007.1 RelA/SpoT [Penicillium angulare]
MTSTPQPRSHSQDEPFGSPSQAMSYFEGRLELYKQSRENPANNSLPEVLHEFLISIGKNTEASLDQYLKVSGLFQIPLTPCEQTAYKKYEKRYRCLDTNQVLFLIHQEFLVRNPVPLDSPYNMRSNKEKIRIIMSSILWMEEMFPAMEFESWKVCFLKFSRDTIKEDLDWLCLYRQRKFLAGKALPREDDEILKRFWDWFELNELDLVKMAFFMAKKGVFKDVLNNLGRLGRIIQELKRVIELPRPLGPKTYWKFDDIVTQELEVSES